MKIPGHIDSSKKFNNFVDNVVSWVIEELDHKYENWDKSPYILISDEHVINRILNDFHLAVGSKEQQEFCDFITDHHLFFEYIIEKEMDSLAITRSKKRAAQLRKTYKEAK